MSSTDKSIPDRLISVVLRDLQSLLRQSIDEKVLVVDYKTTSLLPPGENYGSSMLKVDATIKKSKESSEEQLHLVAKMMPATEFQRQILNATVSFNKELFVFKKLINAYRQIEEESGVAFEDLFDILPKFYGGRLSLNEDNTEADDDAVLLMENLKTSGYYNVDRLKGLDLDHAKLAITELARFHALGMALKVKQPDLFEEAKEVMKTYPFVVEGSAFEELIQNLVDMICSDSRIAKYADRIKQSTKIRWDYLQNIVLTEPWVTIMHGDFWVNNIMYHKENDKIDSIKFVDFQIAQACSPLKDLPYFLCASLSMEVIDKHFKDLLDVYHSTLVEILEKIGCDISPFTRDNFYKQLKIEASEELFHCLMALKVFTLEAPTDMDLNKMDTEIFATKASNLYLDRVWTVVSKFVEMEWI